jgi:hypothetical protein
LKNSNCIEYRATAQALETKILEMKVKT